MPNDAKEIARAVSVTLLQHAIGKAYDQEAYAGYCMDAVKGLHAATTGPLTAIFGMLGRDDASERAKQLALDSLRLIHDSIEEITQD